MRNYHNYSNIYTVKGQEIMFLKEGGSYSFLEMTWEEDDPDFRSYTEVIVPAEALEEALMELPTSDIPSIHASMQLLFGNSDGLENFHSYCDQYGIDTRTFNW